MESPKLPRWSRDWYCGQCGKKSFKGDVVTEVRYCVFCGQPRINKPVSMPHTCGTHPLRDYWASEQQFPVSGAAQGELKGRRRVRRTQQIPLFGNEVNG